LVSPPVLITCDAEHPLNRIPAAATTIVSAEGVFDFTDFIVGLPEGC
jgi:hypothetical protein